MIVSAKEYASLLANLADPNSANEYLRMPKDETVYKIDLDTRTVQAPSYISVAEDHNAEVVWFSVDRFFCDYDLYQSTCWIMYNNAEGKSFFYLAPMQTLAFDENGNECILIPWIVSQYATVKEGTIGFQFQFFQLSEDEQEFTYKLNTRPASTKVLTSLYVNTSNGLTGDDQSAVASLLDRLAGQVDALTKAYEIYWIDLT